MDPIDFTPAILQHTQYLLNSFKKLSGQELIDRSGSLEEQAERLFYSSHVVVSHDTEKDPIFNYGNQAALDLWEFNWAEFTALPSRYSAEPITQAQRDLILNEVKRQGYIPNYRSVRISRSGKRFWVENAIIWTVTNDQDQFIGQAATFSKWTPI